MNINYIQLKTQPRECRDDDEIVETVGKRYFQIWDFMLFNFKLEKTELYVYAIIFAMHKNYHTYFQGTREYLAKWTNSSVRTVSAALSSLEGKGLIVKCYKNFGNGRRSVYHVNPDALPECDFFEAENRNKRINAKINACKGKNGIKSVNVEIYDSDDELEDGFPYVESAYDLSQIDSLGRT